MSTAISFHQKAIVLPGNGAPIYALLEKVGTSNRIGYDDNISYLWILLAVGSYFDVVAQVTKLSASCAGGTLGVAVTRNTYRTIKPETYIKRWLEAIRIAKPLIDRHEPILVRRYSDPDPSGNFDLAKPEHSLKYASVYEGENTTIGEAAFHRLTDTDSRAQSPELPKFETVGDVFSPKLHSSTLAVRTAYEIDYIERGYRRAEYEIIQEQIDTMLPYVKSGQDPIAGLKRIRAALSNVWGIRTVRVYIPVARYQEALDGLALKLNISVIQAAARFDKHSDTEYIIDVGAETWSSSFALWQYRASEPQEFYNEDIKLAA